MHFIHPHHPHSLHSANLPNMAAPSPPNLDGNPVSSSPAPPAEVSSHRAPGLPAIVRSESLLRTKRKMRILLLSSDTGGGHRASAESLRAALVRLYPEKVHVKIVDFWVDLAEGPFVSFPQQYAFLANTPVLWKFTYEFTRFPPGRALSEWWFNAFGHSKIRGAFDALAPDMIVSVHPLVNTLSMHVLKEMERWSGVPRVPYITVVTDLGGAHPTWFHRGVDMTYIPSDGVRRVGRRVGLREREMRLLGLPVRQDFWEETGVKEAVKARLGLREVPAVLAIGGGDGVGGLKAVVLSLVKVLSERLGGDNVQVVVITGKNVALRKWIASRKWPCLVVPLGYVDNMSDWMTACDIICTKAGPGTIAEALIRGLPIIVTSFLPGQEQANVNYVVENGVGVYARKPSTIAETAAEWLSNPESLEERSRKCREVARPHASLAIAEDIMKVGVDRIKQNIETMQRRQTERTALCRNHLARYIPNAGSITSSSKQSHLVFRLKFMLRVVLGGMLAHEALARDADSN